MRTDRGAHLSIASLFSTQVAAATITAFVLALALLALKPKERASTRNAIIVLGLCALTELAEMSVDSMGWHQAARIAGDMASVLIGAVLIRLATIFVFQVFLPWLRLEPARIVEDLATGGLLVAWGLTFVRLSGVDFASLVTTSAVITAVIAFAMQETLGNVLGGVVLQFERSIQVGDWVRVDDVSGRVLQIRWRHTAILTRNGETVIVPNGWMMKNRFTVIASREHGQLLWRRWIRIEVDFSAPPTRVCVVLENALRNAEVPHVVMTPPPSAVLLEIGPRYGGYALRYWMDDPEPDDATDSRVRAHVLAAIARHGMKIGAPYHERGTIKDDEEHRAAARERELQRRRNGLAQAKLFASLTKEEIEVLVTHLVDAPFVAGATLTRQGAVAHWLYIIVSGEADVWFEGHDGQRTLVSTLTAGSVFGEMGMMTGEPRRATVTARTDVECYRLDKEGFQIILAERADIADEMARELAERESELQGKREFAALAARTPTRKADILDRIRAFFGLEEPKNPASQARES